MASDRNKKEPTSSFTVDHDHTGLTGMPSVTRLLNRKSLGLSTTSKSSPRSPAPSPSRPSPPAPELAKTKASALEPVQNGASISAPTSSPVAPSAPTEISLSLDSSSETDLSLKLETSSSPATAPASAESTSRIQPAKPRSERRSATRLTLWDPNQLASGPDPLGQGLAMLLQRGVKHALFLALTSPPSGSPVPHFIASAAVLAPREKLGIWTGLKWDPTVVPELWNAFVRSGQVELSPPGTSTNIQSSRNVVRAAFGIEGHEWLLLVRAGAAAHCRGVLALIAEKSLLNELPQALPLLAAPAPSGSKKPAA